MSANSPGVVIWISGLSGAGKTSFGLALVDRIEAHLGHLAILLDGDDLRRTIYPDLGYEASARVEIARRTAGLCASLKAQGHWVVCCSVSCQRAIYAYNRERLGEHLNIFMDAPLAALRARDGKGLYDLERRGLSGPVLGIDIPCDPPEDGLVVTNDFTMAIEAMADNAWPILSTFLTPSRRPTESAARGV